MHNHNESDVAERRKDHRRHTILVSHSMATTTIISIVLASTLALSTFVVVISQVFFIPIKEGETIGEEYAVPPSDISITPPPQELYSEDLSPPRRRR